MCARIIRLMALLGCLMLGSPTLALAQADQERVALVMSKLPPQQSAAYKALKARLTTRRFKCCALTKSEIWSVPRGESGRPESSGGATRHEGDAVHRADRQRGDEAPPNTRRDPRSIARTEGRLEPDVPPAPADMKMNDKQKHDGDRQGLQSTMGVGMMAAPMAPMVEYALTKDAGPNIAALQGAPRSRSSSARDRADDRAHQRRHQARHVHLARRGRGHRRAGDDHVVAGRQDGRHGAAPGPHLFDPAHGRRDARRGRDGRGPMPQEHAPMPERMRANDPNLRDDPLVNRATPASLRPDEGQQGARQALAGHEEASKRSRLARRPTRRRQ